MAKKRNPLRPLIEQIAEIVNLFEKGQKKGPSDNVPEDVEAKVTALEEGTKLIKLAYEEALQQEGVTKEQIAEEFRKKAAQMSPEEQKALLNIQMLRFEVGSITNALATFLESIPKPGEKRRPSKERKASRLEKRHKRRKKGWKKL